MEITEERFSKLKLALRIDTNLDDNLLKTYMNTAQDYLVGAIGPSEEFYKDNSRFETAVYMLTDHFYRERAATTTASNIQQVPLGVQALILQMKPDYALIQQQKVGDIDGDHNNGDVEPTNQNPFTAEA
ncbi:MAG: head-tail connector protein [Lentilactobacillus diolivorans]